MICLRVWLSAPLPAGLFFFVAMKFSASRLKIERAMKHIRDLNYLLDTFAKSDFYSVRVEEHKGRNRLFIDIDKTGFSTIDAALIIGDVLHNLRSAIDIAYFQAFYETTAIVDHRTRFPVRDERHELIGQIDGGLKEKGLADHPSAIKIRNLVVDVIKPYQAGNYTLWALRDLNITDKHQLLVPLFDIMRFSRIYLQEDAEVFLIPIDYITEDSYSWWLDRSGKITVQDKGHAAIAIIFNLGTAFQNQPIIPALHGIAKEVTRTIDAFDNLGLRGFFD